MKAVIFDFDGTIADSAPAILATLETVLERHGIKPQRPLQRDLIGPPLPDTLLKLTGFTDKAQLVPLIADFKIIYDGEGVRATGFYAGMEGLLRKLAGDYRLFLATNKRQRPTELLLAMADLRRCFAGVFCLDSQDPPHADKSAMLVALLQQESLTAADCLYIGDTCHDEVAAGKAGMAFLAVGWGYGVGVQRVSARAEVAGSADALAAAIAGHFRHSNGQEQTTR